MESLGTKYTEPVKKHGVGDVHSWYLKKGSQHCQAPWARQGLFNFGKCSAEVNHVDLETT